MNDERFEQLWQGLREQVRAAREKGGDRDFTKSLQGASWEDQMDYGGTVCAGKGDEDGAILHLHGRGANMCVSFNAAGMMGLAAQCVAAAIEIEEAKEEAAKVRPTTQQRA